MVDIAAQLSLTASGPAIDPAAILGAKTADSQAFGDILTGHVAGSLAASADSGAPATPLPPFPAPAGNRQPTGKILPGAAQILPDAALLRLEAPAAQALPSAVAIPAVRLVTTASVTHRAPLTAATTVAAIDAPEPKQVEASPVHGLIKMLTAALKGQRPAAATAEDAPAASETASGGSETAEDTTHAAAAELAALPILLAPAAPAPQADASKAMRATSGGAAPILVAARAPAPSQQAEAAVPENIQPALAQFLAQPVPAGQVQQVPAQTVQAQTIQTQPIQAQPAQVQPATSTEALAVPVLTIAATPGGVSAAAVTLGAAPVPIGHAVAARIKVAPAADQDGSALATGRSAAMQPPFAGRDVAAVAPIAAGLAAPAVRAVLAERAAAELGPVPATAEGQPPLAAAVPGVTAAATPVTTTGVPAVEMPRHDFAALVDRLVEARNASAPQSIHASLDHAEFGQVSLNFQQDGDDLKVAMSSADPDFARAAQAAAQSGQPTERQNFTADTNPRGQAQGQAQMASSSSHSQHEASGRDTERSDQQGRNGQGRNSRGGNNSSNPPPRWAGPDQPQTRGDIFA
jgi:hypothetical protein